MNNKESLAHTSWNCKFHIVFAPKYRRREIYGALRRDIGRILRMLCERNRNNRSRMLHRPCTYVGKNTTQIQRVADSRIPQGKSSLMIFDRHANLKYKYGNRHFWCRGYFVDTVGKNTKKIEEYIKNQITEDIMADKMNMKEYIDPFTGEPVGNKQ